MDELVARPAFDVGQQVLSPAGYWYTVKNVGVASTQQRFMNNSAFVYEMIDEQKNRHTVWEWHLLRWSSGGVSGVCIAEVQHEAVRNVDGTIDVIDYRSKKVVYRDVGDQHYAMKLAQELDEQQHRINIRLQTTKS